MHYLWNVSSWPLKRRGVSRKSRTEFSRGLCDTVSLRPPGIFKFAQVPMHIFGNLLCEFLKWVRPPSSTHPPPKLDPLSYCVELSGNLYSVRLSFFFHFNFVVCCVQTQKPEKEKCCDCKGYVKWRVWPQHLFCVSILLVSVLFFSVL